jgi:hypothetical protein
MAKKITQTEGEAQPLDLQPDNAGQTSPVSETAPDTTTETAVKTEVETVLANEAEASASPTPAPAPTPASTSKAEKKSEAAKPSSVIPEHIDRILRTNSAYAELWIDLQGGTYTVNTSPALRGTATLYTNPYHKRP